MSRPQATPERVAKLPSWAQAHIFRLERDVAALRARLSVGPEDSSVFANPYHQTPTPLGDASVQFDIGEAVHGRRPNVQVRREDGGDNVFIMGSESLAIEPRSSNTLVLRVAPR